MRQLTVTAVSYLNTKPLLYGIFRAGLEQELTIELDIPAVCAQKLIDGRADIGLIPVGALPQIPDAQLITDYCIGAVGAVRTVCIYAEVPISQITHLYLDYHSRTSVRLAQVLLRDYWRVQPALLPTGEGSGAAIGGTTGAVLIGDKTFGLAQQYQYTYDLAEVWQQHTGLPFVFAVWVSRVPLAPAFLARFNAALADGIAHIPQLCQLIPPPEADFTLEDYYTRYISYTLDAPKREAMRLFLSLL